MKNHQILCHLVLPFALLAAIAYPSLPCFSQETPEQIVSRLVGLGEGVHEVKEEDGVLVSLKVVGTERISTVLGAAKGLQTAQKRATLKANAAFVEWMKSNVSSISTSTDESIVTLAGDGENISEQGKASETFRQEIATKAEGLVRGLALVAKDQDPDTKLLTLIFTWSPQRAGLADDAARANADPRTARQSPAPTADSGSAEIPRKTVISPDF